MQGSSIWLLPLTSGSCAIITRSLVPQDAMQLEDAKNVRFASLSGINSDTKSPTGDKIHDTSASIKARFQHLLESREYSKCLDLAKKHGDILNVQQVYQQQWVDNPADLGIAAKIGDKLWLIEQAFLLKVHRTLLQTIAEYCSVLLDGLVPGQNGITEERLLLYRSAVKNLGHLLRTHEKVRKSTESCVCWEFVRTPMIKNALRLAASGDAEGLQHVFKRHHGLVGKYKLAVLERFPILIDPDSYSEVLPGVNDRYQSGKTGTSSNGKSPQSTLWDNDVEPEPLHEAGQEEPYVRVVCDLLNIKYNATGGHRLEEADWLTQVYRKDDREQALSSWYLKRAITFAYEYDLPEHACSILGVGVSKAVPDLRTLHSQLSSYLDLLTVIESSTSPVELAFPEFLDKPPAEIIQIFFRVTTRESLKDATKGFLGKYLRNQVRSLDGGDEAGRSETFSVVRRQFQELAKAARLDDVCIMLETCEVPKSNRLAKAAILASEFPYDVWTNVRSLKRFLAKEESMLALLDCFMALAAFGVTYTLQRLEQVASKDVLQLQLLQALRVSLRNSDPTRPGNGEGTPVSPGTFLGAIGDGTGKEIPRSSRSWRAILEDLRLIQRHVTPQVPFATFVGIFVEGLLRHAEPSVVSTFLESGEYPKDDDEVNRVATHIIEDMLLNEVETCNLETDLQLASIFVFLQELHPNSTSQFWLDVLEAAHRLSESCAMPIRPRDLQASDQREGVLLGAIQGGSQLVQDSRQISVILSKLHLSDPQFSALLVLQSCVSSCILADDANRAAKFGREIINNAIVLISQESFIRTHAAAVTLQTIEALAQFEAVPLDTRAEFICAGRLVEQLLADLRLRQTNQHNFAERLTVAKKQQAWLELLAVNVDVEGQLQLPIGELDISQMSAACLCMIRMLPSHKLVAKHEGTVLDVQEGDSILSNVTDLEDWAFGANVTLVKDSHFGNLIKGFSTAIAGTQEMIGRRTAGAPTAPPKPLASLPDRVLSARKLAHRIVLDSDNVLEICHLLWAEKQDQALAYLIELDSEEQWRLFLRQTLHDDERIDVYLLFLTAIRNLLSLRALENPEELNDDLVNMSVEQILETWNRETTAGADREYGDQEMAAFELWKRTYQRATKLKSEIARANDDRQLEIVSKLCGFDNARFYKDSEYRDQILMRAIDRVNSLPAMNSLMDVCARHGEANDNDIVLKVIERSLCTWRMDDKSHWESWLERVAPCLLDTNRFAFHTAVFERCRGRIDGRWIYNLGLLFELIVATSKKAGEKAGKRLRLAKNWLEALKHCYGHDFDVKILVEAVRLRDIEAFELIAPRIAASLTVGAFAEVVLKSFHIAFVEQNEALKKEVHVAFRSRTGLITCRYIIRRGVECLKAHKGHVEKLFEKMLMVDLTTVVNEFVFPPSGFSLTTAANLVLDMLDLIFAWQTQEHPRAHRLISILLARKIFKQKPDTESQFFDWASRIWNDEDFTAYSLCSAALDHGFSVVDLSRLCDVFAWDAHAPREVPEVFTDVLEETLRRSPSETSDRLIKELSSPGVSNTPNAPFRIAECIQTAVHRVNHLVDNGDISLNAGSVGLLKQCLAQDEDFQLHERISNKVKDSVGMELHADTAESYSSLLQNIDLQNYRIIIRVLLASQTSYTRTSRLELNKRWADLLMFVVSHHLIEDVLWIYAMARPVINLDLSDHRRIAVAIMNEAKSEQGGSIWLVALFMSLSADHLPPEAREQLAQSVVDRVGDLAGDESSAAEHWFTATMTVCALEKVEYESSEVVLLDAVLMAGNDLGVSMSHPSGKRAYAKLVVQLIIDAVEFSRIEDDDYLIHLCTVELVKVWPAPALLKHPSAQLLREEIMEDLWEDLQSAVLTEPYSGDPLTDDNLFFDSSTSSKLEFYIKVVEWWLRHPL